MNINGTIFVLDITIDTGAKYDCIGVFSSQNKAREQVKNFIADYNNSLDASRGEVMYEYRDDIWQHTEPNELVFPFGPGAEFRLRKFTLNKAFHVDE